MEGREDQIGVGCVPHRIDVHHHLVPPTLISTLGAVRTFEAPSRNWTVEKSIEDMDRAGVATAILSITVPGLWFGDVEQARYLSRACNDYAAELRSRYPGRFGIFACIPLPDAVGSMAEIEYAFDELGADGVALFTNYDGKYLGDASFSEVLRELNRRKAVVHVHPICADCAKNLVPEVSRATIEYGTDTARSIASFLFSGAANRFRDLEMIFSHAGGTMPLLLERFAIMERRFASLGHMPNGLMHELARLHYDTAQAANPAAMDCLGRLVDVNRILFGTDFPYRTAEEHATGLRRCGFDERGLRAIERENALNLFPRLREMAMRA
jgi:predicted TIM-barrel fold metal-dependent hydrolase